MPTCAAPSNCGDSTEALYRISEHSLRERAPLQFPWVHHDERSKNSLSRIISKFFVGNKRAHKRRAATYTFLDWLQFFLPCVRWLRTYHVRSMLPGDLTAGISVGVMIVSQGLSYATLAGVPAVYGLYGAFLPCMAYALVGTSRQLAVGPVAVTSIIIGTSMRQILPCAQDISNPNQLTTPEQQACQAEYNTKVIQVALLVACMYTGVGIFRMGWLTNFLSHAVISGFTSGASIIISLSQVKYILGYAVKPEKDTLYLILQQYVQYARDFQWQEFIMGSSLLILLVVMKDLGKRLRHAAWLRTLGPLTACVVGLVVVAVAHVDRAGISIIGHIPAGLPKTTITWWAPINDIGQLLQIAAVVMLVDLLESTSIARALARKNGYELNYNLEIVGLGLANFAGAAFNAYTTTGSFSRSAINDLAGSKSPLSQLVTAIVVGIVLLFLTPLFSNLPYNVLGAVILASVTTLFEYEQVIYLFRVSKLDCLVWLASFLGTLFISVEIGLGIAIGLALLLAVYQTAFPHLAVLGRVPNSTLYRSVKQYPDATVTPGILMFRIGAALYFANCKTVQDRLGRVMAQMDFVSRIHGLPGLLHVILDLTPVHHVDAMGLHLLENLVLELKARGQQLILANPSSRVLHEMEPVKLAELLGREWIFVSVHDAMLFCITQLADMGLYKESVVLQPGQWLDEDESSVAPSRDEPELQEPAASSQVRLVQAHLPSGSSERSGSASRGVGCNNGEESTSSVDSDASAELQARLASHAPS